MSAIPIVTTGHLLLESLVTISEAARILDIDRRDLRRRLTLPHPPLTVLRLGVRVVVIPKVEVLEYRQRLVEKHAAGNRRTKRRP